MVITAGLLICCLIEQGGSDWLYYGSLGKQGGIVIDLVNDWVRDIIVCENTRYNKFWSF